MSTGSPSTPAVEPPRVGYKELVFTNANFRNLWIGQIISLLGDWFNLIASATLLSELTHSGLAIGALFVVRMLAPFVVSPFAGVATDRYNRKWLLIIADVFRALTVAGFLLVRNAEDVWLLYTLTAIQLGFSGLFFPARNAILPEIVEKRELGVSNTLLAATWSVMLALGAALGGLASGAWGFYPAFTIDSVTFLVSAFFVARIVYTPGESLEATDADVSVIMGQYIDGLKYLRRNFDILVITLQKAAFALALSGGFQVVQVTLAEEIYVIGEGGGISLGIFYSVVGVGTGVGPIIARHFTRDEDRPLRVAIACSYAIGALGLLLVASLYSFGVVALGAFLRGVGAGIGWVFSTQLLLQLLPDKVRGRVFSTEFAMLTLMNASGAAITGFLIDTAGLSISGVLWLMGGTTLFFGVLWVLWTAFGSRAHPEEAGEIHFLSLD